MHHKWQQIFLSFFILLTSNHSAFADLIELPEDELARETVLPVFDKRMVVRNRTVTTEKRFELGGGIGLNASEPLYEQMSFNLYGTYHFSEVHGVNVFATFVSDELSQAGKDLKAGKGLIGPAFDASRAPNLESLMFVNYQFTAYYGKMSVTKKTTMNLSLYGLLGVGLANWSDASEFAADFGVGQKLYLNKNFGLRFDLIVAMYLGPDPTNPNSGVSMEPTAQKHASSDFDSNFYFRPFLLGSAFYLF